MIQKLDLDLARVTHAAFRLFARRKMYLLQNPAATWADMKQVSDTMESQCTDAELMIADVASMCLGHLEHLGINIPTGDQDFVEAVMDIAQAEIRGDLNADSLHDTSRRAWVLWLEYKKRGR